MVGEADRVDLQKSSTDTGPGGFHAMSPRSTIALFHGRRRHPGDRTIVTQASSRAQSFTDEIPKRPQVLEHVIALDQRAFEKLSNGGSPATDLAMGAITNASRHSRLLVLIAGALSVLGGGTGRRSAGEALVAVGVTTTVTGAIVKRPVQQRPSGSAPGPVLPSGRTASAAAFATVVGHHVPLLRIPLEAFAAAVGASRVYNGVHHPRNVLLGWLFGKGVGITVLRIGRAVETRRTQRQLA